MRFFRLFQAKTTAQAGHIILCLALHCTAAFFCSLTGQAQTIGQEQCLPQSPPVLPDLPPSGLSPLQQSLYWLLKSKPTARFGFTGLQDDPAQMDALLTELYMDCGIIPRWVTEYGPDQKRVHDLLEVLEKAGEEGLVPARYRPADIVALLPARDRESLARLDILLTLAMSSYINDMRKGRAASSRFDPNLLAAVRDSGGDVPQMIKEGLISSNLKQFLAMQAPQHQAYFALKKLLAEYRRIEAAGGWPQIPTGKKLEPGMADERLGLLAQRLLITGDLPSSSATDIQQKTFEMYDDELVKAVKHFQTRYNLEHDGIIGTTTLIALNIPVQDHISKIILNLERWRWLPHQLGGRRLLVNIAGFSLTGMNDEQTELFMPVIVGEFNHKTPVFSEAMTYMEINPYWTVPPSIARKEIVGKMQKDPRYLSKQRIRIFTGWHESAAEISPAAINWHTIGAGITRYRLRQEPGKGNALGTIKFIFPNNKSIYMHDTPGQALFKQVKRSFSHGCIRVSRPLDLATYILQHDGQEMSEKQLKKRIASGKQIAIILKNPIPVHILYLTALVAEDGTAHFYDDVYGNDALLAEALRVDSPDKPGQYSFSE
ncbi:MAG: Murein L,D-transpeptidase YcbB/YkuD [Candidatus Electronema aureum]|uniref:Murein L,D-transpeptidase YcbB/YkuD n=1 Tax=Candidatus Electronema aureum TaxID=2005002 RepID=A0A521FYV1_9BACT|nr:MAG: Murein L,D-transpeptidase YcbB/YkuD [Candidatus Electronema aureum]